MVFRRPYAFLIKYFRLIHIILFILFAYITFKANSILTFFKDYINYKGSMEIISSDYINVWIFIFSILIIGISIIIFFLMRYKKKPKLFYVITSIVSVISIILFLYLYGNIKVLESTSMAAREIRLLRDISRFNYWMLFIMCIPTLIRGLGFDIKKFNFNKDLQDLNLSKEDSEEIEISTNLSSDKILTTGRRGIRELKYYYAENKFFINIILGVVAVILILIFPFNKFVIHGTLSEKQMLSTRYFNFKVIDSYVSDRNRISRDNAYVIVKFSTKGKISKYNFKLDNFVLKSKDNDYIPSLKYYYYFLMILVQDIKREELATNKYNEYIFVYNINSEDKNSKFTLNYLGNDRKIRPLQVLWNKSYFYLFCIMKDYIHE